MTIQSVNLFAPRHRHATYHQLYRSHTPRSQTSADDTPVSSLVPSAVASMEQPVPGELTDELIAVLSITNRELELEAAEVDRAVRILPGVKALLESIPEGHYAVATSGAKTYGALWLPIPFLSLPCGFGRGWADGLNT